MLYLFLESGETGQHAAEQGVKKVSTENPKREHPGTYLVRDRFTPQEHERIRLQDEMLTLMMGGVLPEQPNPTLFREVLDVGCGCGSWLIEMAKTYPHMTRLVGVDASRTIIEYAQAQAEAAGVADRVEFHVMDALRLLEFPDDSFDLVNQRLGSSYIRSWEWPNVLLKYQRVVRPQGTIRISECDIVQGNSPAFTQLSDIFLTTLFKAGHLKTQQKNDVIDMLPTLFTVQGCQHVQTYLHSLRYPAGTRAREFFVEDMKYIFHDFVPFFRKWMRLPDNYEEIYQQALVEIQQPDFVGSWNFLTVWGNPPISKVRTRNR